MAGNARCVRWGAFIGAADGAGNSIAAMRHATAFTHRRKSKDVAPFAARSCEAAKR
jgi:hypothetical protein